MDENVKGQNAMSWISILLSVVFMVLGLGILTGLFYPDKAFLQGGMRIVFGLVIFLFGSVRITMAAKRLQSEKRRKSEAKKT